MSNKIKYKCRIYIHCIVIEFKKFLNQLINNNKYTNK